jgi:hypothetical protein
MVLMSQGWTETARRQIEGGPDGLADRVAAHVDQVQLRVLLKVDVRTGEPPSHESDDHGAVNIEAGRRAFTTTAGRTVA